MSQRSTTRPLQRATTTAGRRRRSSVSARHRRSRSGLLRRHRSLRWLLLGVSVFCGLGLGGMAAAFAEYQNLRSQLPDAATLAAMEEPVDTKVYAHVPGHAPVLLAILHNQDFRHEHVDFDQVSLWAKEATIDVEDRHFYENNSWDLGRILTAGWNDLRSRSAQQGASTITEQLAKISFLCGGTCERSLDRKMKQVILGIDIENSFSKNQILEMYLNRIDYGNNAIGIETAAQIYFLESAHDLTLPQASLLAGLPNAPSTLNPLLDSDRDLTPPPDKLTADDLATLHHLSSLGCGAGAPAAFSHVNPLAKARQCTVLHAMVNNGDISQAAAEQAYATPLTFHPESDSDPGSKFLAPAFVSYLQQWLTDRYGDEFRKPGGWTIVTSLDLWQNPDGSYGGKQTLAEDVVKNDINGIFDNVNAHDAALVSMNPKTGAILAMVGAYDKMDDCQLAKDHVPGAVCRADVGATNMATQYVRPGSTIKLFTYTAAIASRKFNVQTPVLDAPISLNDGSPVPYQPKNYDRSYHGVCNLAHCLGNSLNIPAVKVEAQLGVPLVTDLEIAAGLKSLEIPAVYDTKGNVLQPSHRPGPLNYAATLGGLTYGVTPLELADGVSTIASLGVHHDPAPVQTITDRSGRVIYAHDPTDPAESQRILPSGVPYIISEVTSNDSNRSLEFGAHSKLTLPDRRVSAKTGTTENFTDNWTVGWTPDIATVVWVGNPQPSCLRGGDVETAKARLAAGRGSYYGEKYDDPLSPDDVRALGLQPISNHCGHLVNSTGITGAAPIWNDFMRGALAGAPAHWYDRPADVIAFGRSDDAPVFLAGTENAYTDCYYYGDFNPESPCRYAGPTAPPSPSPSPGAAPAPSPTAAPSPGQGGGPPGPPAGGPPPPPPPAGTAPPGTRDTPAASP